MNKRSLFITLAMLVVALLAIAYSTVFAGTKPVPTAPIPEFTIKAVDYAFEAPTQITAGVVILTMVNEGQELHHGQLARLNEGLTLEQFQAALQQGPEAAMPMITFVGGPGLLDPGLSQQVTLDLTPGL